MDVRKLKPALPLDKMKDWKPSKFYEHFGDMYIIGQVSGVRLVGRLESVVTSLEERSSITAGIEAAYKYATTHADGSYKEEEEATKVSKELESTHFELEIYDGIKADFPDPTRFFLAAATVPSTAEANKEPLFWVLSRYDDIPEYLELLLHQKVYPGVEEDLRYVLQLSRYIASLDQILDDPHPELFVGEVDTDKSDRTSTTGRRTSSEFKERSMRARKLLGLI